MFSWPNGELDQGEARNRASGAVCRPKAAPAKTAPFRSRSALGGLCCVSGGMWPGISVYSCRPGQAMRSYSMDIEPVFRAGIDGTKWRTG